MSLILFPLLVFLSGCCFGPSAALVKMAYEYGFDSGIILYFQYVFGLIVVVIAAIVFRIIKVLRKLPDYRVRGTVKDYILIVIAGTFFGLASLTYYFSLKSIPAHVAIILLFQFTWIAVLIDSVVKRKRPNITVIISILILFVASFFAVGFGSGSLDHLNPVGVLLGLCSALSYALYIQFIGRLNKDIIPIHRSLFMVLISFIILSIIFIPMFVSTHYITSMISDGNLWEFGILLGVFSCALPNILLAISSPKVSAGMAGILCSSELPASIICSVIMISEKVTWIQWIGVFLLVFAIALPWIANYLKKTKTETENHE